MIAVLLLVALIVTLAHLMAGHICHPPTLRKDHR